jgi:hypothetical protein
LKWKQVNLGDTFSNKNCYKNEMPYNHSFRIWNLVQEEMSKTATEQHMHKFLFCAADTDVLVENLVKNSE